MLLVEITRRIQELQSRLDGLRPLNGEQERRIMDKFRLDWNYHSNKLEGNSLTYGETKALLLFNITAQGKPLKDHLEIKGHNEAILWIEDVIRQERPLTENFIRELHQLILKEPYQINAITPDGQPTRRWVRIGQYKEDPNHVKTVTGELFRFATPEETPAMMHDLLEWYREELLHSRGNNWMLGATFHYRFIRIHPFDDGNGRLARILMNFILMQQGFPPVVIKTKEKPEYFRALQQADAGNLEAFVGYIGEQLAYSLDLMLRGIMGENIEEEDDVDKQIALLKASLKTGSTGETLIKKAVTVLQSTYIQSIEPFLKALELKIATFDELFAERSSTYMINGSEFAPPDQRSIEFFREALFNPDKLAFLAFSSSKTDEAGHPVPFVNSLSILYKWREFKKNDVKAFDIIEELIIQFNESKYIISSSFITLYIEKFYHQPLTPEEANQLVKVFTKEIVSSIQQNLK